MHQSVYDFVARVKEKFPEAFTGKIVHEVGSRNINGTVRTFFSRCDYTGFDLGYGPCVDVVMHYNDTNEKYMGQIDTVISCEALEHDRQWRATCLAMVDNLKPGGLLIITAGGPGRPEHGTTEHDPECSPETLDHYHNIDEADFRGNFKGMVPFPFKEFEFDVRDGDFRFWGIKA